MAVWTLRRARQLLLVVGLMFVISTAKTGAAVSVTERGGQFVLSGDDVVASVDRGRGTITRIQSLRPVPLDVLPETKDGLSLTITDKWTGKSAVFNRVGAIRASRKAGYAVVEATLLPAGAEFDGAMTAQVEYRLYPDRFRAIVDVRYLKDLTGPYELAFGQASPRSDFWQSQGFPGLFGNLDVLTPELSEKARQETSPLSRVVYQRFNDHPDDVTKVPDTKLVRYPYGILEGPDRFLLYARMDVNGFVYLGAGHNGMNPCMLVTPKAISRGKSYTFDITYKVFPKSQELDYGDVCLWYAQNCFSTNRLTKGIVAIPKDLKPRTLIGDGNEASGPAIPAASSPEYIEWAAKAHLGHFWDGWTEFDEIPTLDREFVEMRGQKLDEETVRREMDDRKSRGWHSYSYRRQLFPSVAYRNDRPWKREWMLTTKPGTVFVCPTGPAPINDLPYGDAYSPEADRYLREDLGITAFPKGRVCYVHADFCNDECRDFYTNALQKWIDKYQCLDGFAFDMGWDIHTVPCLKHPDDGTHHGIVKLMADIYKDLEKNHPDQRVVMNMLQGSPSNLWCHGVMFEGGTGITYEGVESVKIYRATMFAHNYVWQFKSVHGDRWLPQIEHDMMANLAMGVIIGMGDPMLFAEDPNLNGKLDLYALSARLPSHPLVIETGAFLVNGVTRRDVHRSVFADATACHALLFNNTNAPKAINARIRARYLKPYGWNGSVVPSKAMRFDARGYLRADAGLKISRDGEDIIISGELGPGELAAVTSI